MRTITNLLTAIVLAAWLVAIAIISIQNITPINLKFLIYETIQIPFGIVLALSVGVGAIAGAMAPILWKMAGGQREPYYEEEDF
jgi:uncharacterized integral membrane protein